MKTYLFNVIPKLQQYSEKLDNTALLTSQHWVVIDDESSQKVTYIFRANGDLLISQSGKVQKAKWEYLGNQTLLIDKSDGSYLFRHGFFNENLLALKVDGSDEYAVLVTDEQYSQGFKSADDIQKLLDVFIGQTVDSSHTATQQLEVHNPVIETHSANPPIPDKVSDNVTHPHPVVQQLEPIKEEPNTALVILYILITTGALAVMFYLLQ